METNVIKRVLSLLLVLALILVPMQVTAFADDAAEEAVEIVEVAQEEEAAEVVADLSALDKPIAPPSDIIYPEERQSSGGGDFESDTEYVEYIPEIKDGTFMPLKDENAITPFAAPASPVEGVTKHTFYEGKSDTNVVTTAVAVGSKSTIWLADNADAKTSGKYLKAHTDAMLNEFESNIYGLVTGIVGNPLFINATGKPTSGKVNIVLIDIPPVGSLSTGGYFTGNDYLFSNGVNGSNEDSILYINIYDTLYDDIVAGTPFDIYGTIAHEFQHLTNFSRWLKLALDGKVPPNDGRRATWMNEGLSGLVDHKYRDSQGVSDLIERSHQIYFLANSFESGVGQVPTTAKWNAIPGNNVLANYGASAYQMIMYSQKGNPAALLDDLRTDYAGSKDSVAANYWNDSSKTFDDFFALHALNYNVSTPVSSISNIQAAGLTPYVSPIGYNEWAERVLGDGSVAGVGMLNPTGDTPMTSGGRDYYTNVALATTVGATNNAATVTIPTDGVNKYYIITPFNEKNVDDYVKWALAPKIAAELKPGENKDIIVGTNNMFAVLAVNFATPLSGTVKYDATAVKTIAVSSVVTNPAFLTAGDAGQSITVNVASDMIPDSSAIVVSLVNSADDSDVTGGLSNIAGAVINSNAATITADIDQTLPTGSYKVKLVSDGVQTLSTPIILSMPINLADPLDGATDVSATLASVKIAFGADAKVGNGRMSIAELGGDTYFYTALANNVTGATAEVPVGEFVSVSKERITLGYSGVYNVHVDAGAFEDAEGNPTGAKDLGSFTVEGEPAGPSALPASMKLVVGETGKLLAFFGSDGLYDSATIVADDATVAGLSKDAVTTSGDNVVVSGLRVGQTNITLGFSSTTEEEVFKTVLVTVISDGSPGTSYYTRGGSGSGYTGSSKPDVSPNVGVSAKTSKMDKAVAVKLTNAAVDKAVKEGKEVAVVRVKDVKLFSLDVLQAMAKIAEDKGVELKLNVDTTDPATGLVDVRMSINPAEATKDMNLHGSTLTARPKSIGNVFAKFFTNDMTVQSLSHEGDFGCEVEMAVKVSDDLNTEDLAFYTYNSESNTYAKVKDAEYTVNNSGYVRFTSENSGDFLITDGPFVK